MSTYPVHSVYVGKTAAGLHLAEVREIIDAVADGCLVATAGGIIVFANAAAGVLFGYDAHELVGQPLDLLIPVELRDRHAAHLARLRVEQNSSIWGVRREVVGVQRQGKRFPIDLHVGYFGSGERRLYVATMCDITERRIAQQRLQQKAEELEAVNHELTRLRDEANAANRAKSEFLANMSHEIRTPMTAILGFAEALAEAEPGTSDWRDTVETIRRNGEHLLNVINDILDISIIEAGQLRIERREFVLPDLLEETVATFRGRAQAKGLVLDTLVREAVPWCVVSDPTRIRQILVNLLGNAIKFTNQGRITLAVRCQRDADNRYRLEFEVSDTGIGISADENATLFRPFCQADSSMTRRHGGTGLGLSISHKLAEMLGGDLTVQSQLGQGSTFHVTIPVTAVDPETRKGGADPIPERQPAAPTPLQGLRILLVEDGPDNQRLITRLLRRAGAEVEIAAHGQQAIDLLDAQPNPPFDTILMDMQMPVLDGYAATRYLRTTGYAGRIVALTAHAAATDRQRCLDAGCDEFLTKPIDRQRLIDTLQECPACVALELPGHGNTASAC